MLMSLKVFTISHNTAHIMIVYYITDKHNASLSGNMFKDLQSNALMS